MLAPKRVKWRKQRKGRNRGFALRGGTIQFGDYALQAVGRGRITARQLEASRVAMTRFIKRGGDIWVRVFPDKPITKKPAETRMGGGKGSVEEWAAVIKPGRIIYEMAGIPKEEAFEALRLASHKLSIKCKAIARPVALRALAKLAPIEPPAPKKPAAAPEAAVQ